MVAQTTIVTEFMKIFLKYLLLFIAALLWVVGCVPTFRKTAFEWGLTKDSYRYGDLYRLSNLPQFKEEQLPCSNAPRFDSPTDSTALYIIGDSFTEHQRVGKQDFNVGAYTRIHWNETETIQLDTSRRNILVLQTVERHFREHFAAEVRNFTFGSQQLKVSKFSLEGWMSGVYQSFEETLKESEESLASFLFSGDIFLTLKECKASINLQWFDRHNDQVALSPNKTQLLFVWDTDSSRITSSFKHLPENELKTLIHQVNQTSDYYKSLGFDEVYLSIIPNKTSIVAPNLGSYNHLIERVQRDSLLQTPFIDVWTPYSQQSTTVYSLSDTHWSCTGRAIWLEKINGVLSLR